MTDPAAPPLRRRHERPLTPESELILMELTEARLQKWLHDGIEQNLAAGPERVLAFLDSYLTVRTEVEKRRAGEHSRPVVEAAVAYYDSVVYTGDEDAFKRLMKAVEAYRALSPDAPEPAPGWTLEISRLDVAPGQDWPAEEGYEDGAP